MHSGESCKNSLTIKSFVGHHKDAPCVQLFQWRGVCQWARGSAEPVAKATVVQICIYIVATHYILMVTDHCSWMLSVNKALC